MMTASKQEKLISTPSWRKPGMLDRVMQAWRDSEYMDRRADSMHTDGRSVWSYDACILTELDDGQVVLNMYKYSMTTTRHQYGVAYAVKLMNPRIVHVSDWHATPEMLIAALNAKETS